MTFVRRPIVCECCGQTKLRHEYNSQPGGAPYPNCQTCGNGHNKKGAKRVCSSCGVEKVLTTEYIKLRDHKTRAHIGYTDDCRECRRANDVMRAEAREKGLAREAAKRDDKLRAKKPEPVKLEGFASWLALGAEWSGRSYDPHAMANRHGESRLY